VIFTRGSISNWKAKLTPSDVLLIRALREEGLLVREIAEKFEISVPHCSKILRHKSWRPHDAW